MVLCYVPAVWYCVTNRLYGTVLIRAVWYCYVPAVWHCYVPAVWHCVTYRLYGTELRSSCTVLCYVPARTAPYSRYVTQYHTAGT
jgi:hypothetical protein